MVNEVQEIKWNDTCVGDMPSGGHGRHHHFEAMVNKSIMKVDEQLHAITSKRCLAYLKPFVLSKNLLWLRVLQYPETACCRLTRGSVPRHV